MKKKENTKNKENTEKVESPTEPINYPFSPSAGIYLK